MTTSRSHIEPVSTKASGLIAKVNIFVFKSLNKLQFMLMKNENFW